MKNYRLEKKYMPFGKKSFLKVSALLCVSLSLFACNKEKAPGQSLARVNKDEVTISQLNEEMQRLGPQQTINNKQVLDALIDKQLLIAQAEHEKLDRDPAIMQAIERAKGQILVQAYMQRKLASNAKPTAAEVSSFYEQNPDLFAHRKQYDMKQLMIDSAQLTQELSNFVQTAKNLEDVAAWLASKKIPFASGQLSRTSSDIPAEMNTALKVMAKGQLFSVKEGNRSLIVALLDTKDLPVTEAVAAPQIQQFLMNKKNRESGEAEVARLRAAAKIEYLNQALLKNDKPAAAVAPAQNVAPAPASVPASAAESSHAPASASAMEKGVAGLK